MEDTATQLAQIHETLAEARGTFKAGVIFISVLNALFLPMIVWLFASMLTVREDNVAQSVKIERLEEKCEGSTRLSYTAQLQKTESPKPEKKSKEIIKPAVSEPSATIISLNQTEQ